MNDTISKDSLSRRAANALLSYELFSSGNTQVLERQTDLDESMMELRLHGNIIATLDPYHGLWITDAGWNSKTTSSRLNALPNVKVKGSKLNGRLWTGRWAQITKGTEG